MNRPSSANAQSYAHQQVVAPGTYAPPSGPPPGWQGSATPTGPNAGQWQPPPGPPPGWQQQHQQYAQPAALSPDLRPQPLPSANKLDLPPAYSVLPFDDIDFSKDNVEPMLLLDTTGSMQLPASPHSAITRLELVQRSIGLIVKEMAEADAQAENEQGSDDEGGGLRTVTFSGGKAVDLGDLNPGNLKTKFDRIEWEGSTLIVPGFSKIQDVYEDEFGHLAKTAQPKMVCLIITDGEALDINDLAVSILTMDVTNIYLVFALIGYGQEYDAALHSLQEIGKLNDHIRVIEMHMGTQPSEVADACLRMVR
ncbi:hypothetical protein BC830DRAFT_1104464 [Chytriomyces sp. MP71]|nr:hypothetical protein BC830DRAFT_1104464 [Chytriomyces sp. MP71]